MFQAFLEKTLEDNPALKGEKFLETLAFIEKKYREHGFELQSLLEVLNVLLPLKPDKNTLYGVLFVHLYEEEKLAEDELKNYISPEVQQILARVKKLSELDYSENEKATQVEVLRRMFLAMAKDLRVIVLVLLLRLMKLKHLKLNRNRKDRSQFARETLELYAPIASRLGMHRIKTELEDLAFYYTNSQEYKSISEQLEKFTKSKNKILLQVEKTLKDFLKKNDFEAEVYGRTKSIYSIYRKFKKKNVNLLDNLFDVFAIRVILPSNTDDKGREVHDDLYRVLGLIHGAFKPLSHRFKDYIALPKANGYRSLHTVVLGLAPRELERPVEVQIRNTLLHAEAEYGLPSHWLYKQGVSREGMDSYKTLLQGIKTIQNEIFNSDVENLKATQLDIFRDRIFVMTPRGEVKDLPLGATAIDFAYSVHTDIGNKCVMAKVNSSVVPLGYELQNGEVVEIITKKDSAPKLQWLSIAKTNFAKNKVRAYFSTLDRESNIKEGRKLLNEALSKWGKPQLDQNYSILKNYGGKKLTLLQREGIVEEVGRGGKLANDIIKKIYSHEELLREKRSPKKTLVREDEEQLSHDNLPFEKQILVGGEAGLPIKSAKCCSPGLNDEIVAYVTRGHLIRVHKKNCSILHSLDKKRFIDADWKGKEKNLEKDYRVKIKVTSIKRVGLMRDMTTVISDLGISIIDIVMKQGDSKVHDNFFVLALTSPDQFEKLVDKLMEVSGVLKLVKQG